MVGSTSFLHVRRGDTWIVAVSRRDTNPALVFEFIYRFASVSEAYLGGTFSEAFVRRHDVILYELLDEMIDFGYPQTSDLDTLQILVDPDTEIPELTSITSQVTGNTSWRRADIKHSKNECYLDVVETLNLVSTMDGEILRSSVDGKVMMKAYLSGMPECQVGLNNEHRPDHTQGVQETGIRLSDCSFHHCVNLDLYEHVGEIRFVPPNGEFELMTYRADADIHNPLQVIASVNTSDTHVYSITLIANVVNTLQVSNISVYLPVSPPDGKAYCTTSMGKARFEIGENAVIWRIPRLSGGTKATLSMEVASALTASILVDFNVLMYCASGLAIRYLKVKEESGYRSIKWVRYLTRASSSYIILN